ncbi:MAG: rRNA maturation RNase YbeY [Holophagae bacterium]|jgi:rRNA maturation RNase YbeY
MRRTVNGCLDRFDLGPAEVHILITGDDRIRDLNRRYLGHDAPTDVLSFPDGDELPTGRRLLGEIVISLDAVRRQAAEEGHDELRELEELLLHGTLHLLGYDHAADDGEMNRLELDLRKELLS